MDKEKLFSTILRFLDDRTFIDETIEESTYRSQGVFVFTENSYRVIYGNDPNYKPSYYGVEPKFLYNPDDVLCVEIPYWDYDYDDSCSIVDKIVEDIINQLDIDKHQIMKLWESVWK